jgi:hypothetical protein
MLDVGFVAKVSSLKLRPSLLYPNVVHLSKKEAKNTMGTSGTPE